MSQITVIRVRVKPCVTPTEMIDILSLYDMTPVQIADVDRILWLRGPIERVGQVFREVRGVEDALQDA